MANQDFINALFQNSRDADFGGYTVDDAAGDLANLRRDGEDVPDDITAEELHKGIMELYAAQNAMKRIITNSEIAKAVVTAYPTLKLDRVLHEIDIGRDAETEQIPVDESLIRSYIEGYAEGSD